VCFSHGNASNFIGGLALLPSLTDVPIEESESENAIYLAYDEGRQLEHSAAADFFSALSSTQFLPKLERLKCAFYCNFGVTDEDLYQVISTRAEMTLRFFKLHMCDRSLSLDAYQHLRDLCSRVKISITSSNSREFFCNCASGWCMALQKGQDHN
jgi:hypothetical protein